MYLLICQLLIKPTHTTIHYSPLQLQKWKKRKIQNAYLSVSPRYHAWECELSNLSQWRRRVGDDTHTEKISTSSFHNPIICSSAPLKEGCTGTTPSSCFVFLEEDKAILIPHQTASLQQPTKGNVSLTSSQRAAWVLQHLPLPPAALRCVGPVAVGSGGWPVATKPTSPEAPKLGGSSRRLSKSEKAPCTTKNRNRNVLWAKQRARTHFALSAFGSRASSSFLGAHRLQVLARSRRTGVWVLLALSSALLGWSSSTGF